eukprot:m.14951 g.14951  ORF g.14951 m.14951 type:complete len:277 (-) comp10385_c0_seq1:32-862(-)
MAAITREEDQCDTIARVLQRHHCPYFQPAESSTAAVALLLQYKETHQALIKWIMERVYPQLGLTQVESVLAECQLPSLKAKPCVSNLHTFCLLLSGSLRPAQSHELLDALVRADTAFKHTIQLLPDSLATASQASQAQPMCLEAASEALSTEIASLKHQVATLQSDLKISPSEAETLLHMDSSAKQLDMDLRTLEQAWRSFASSGRLSELSKQQPILDNRLGTASSTINKQLEALQTVCEQAGTVVSPNASSTTSSTSTKLASTHAFVKELATLLS